jgi:adenosylcobyric acid synthase
VAGYEVHHGIVDVADGQPWFTARPGDETTAPEGCRSAAVAGTLWHGIFENDEFRRAYLSETARIAGRGFAPAEATCFTAARQAQFDTLADAIETNLDTDALLRLFEHGPARALPTLRSHL